MMKYFEFALDKPLNYVYSGKFQSPDPDWKHFSRQLADFELIAVTEGTVYLQIDQQNYAIHQGECLLCPPGSKQSGSKSSLCSFYWLHFLYEQEEPFQTIEQDTFPCSNSEHKIYIPFYAKAHNLDKIIILMKHLQDSARSYHNKLQNNYLCTTVLCELFNQHEGVQNRENAPAKRKQLFNDIEDYINWYHTTDIRVSEIADHFGYNKRYISNLFKTVSGVSLKQYIIQKKIDHAKYMLCETNDTISEIAYHLGFNDNHNFMKIFKKSVGLTPSQYRNAYSSRLLFYR